MIRTLNNSWALSRGPFTDRDFIESSDWTLLINNIETHNHEVNQLRKLVSFIPSWRLDDIMVSYATPGGGVGPHFDLYDVFLVQAKGYRSWKIGQDCDASSQLRDDPDLRLLSSFETSEEIITGPKDVLYLPPSKAHWGVAQSESITYSIGFRAPRLNDMIAYWTDERLERLSADELYTDKSMKPAQRSGEIRSDDLRMAKEQILEKFLSTNDSNHWFGDLITQSSTDLAESDLCLEPDWTCVHIVNSSNLAWYEDFNQIHLYANGHHSSFSSDILDMIIRLCDKRKIKRSQLPLSSIEQSIDCIEFLIDTGAAYIE